MEIRHSIDPLSAKGYTTSQLRDNFLISELFVPGKMKLVYTFDDRMIVGGACPAGDKISVEIDEKIIGAPYLLNRREMGIINVGGKGTVITESKTYELELKDGLYLGMGTKEIAFESADAKNPAKFYIVSTPAHTTYPSEKISIASAMPQHLGADETCNKRTIYKYIHPDGVKSCQLVMGVTILAPNNVWNTFPPHTHQRRMESYFYFDIPQDQLVFHYMGEPEETRHIVVRDEEVVLSPSWSIHSGAGTQCYSFIWGMAGENQTFSDMDGIPIDTIK